MGCLWFLVLVLHLVVTLGASTSAHNPVASTVLWLLFVAHVVLFFWGTSRMRWRRDVRRSRYWQAVNRAAYRENSQRQRDYYERRRRHEESKRRVRFVDPDDER